MASERSLAQRAGEKRRAQAATKTFFMIPIIVIAGGEETQGVECEQDRAAYFDSKDAADSRRGAIPAFIETQAAE